MFTSLELRNFKAFGDKAQRAPLSKINLIYGPNSGGKSSLIQALLLMKQSQESFGNLRIIQRNQRNASLKYLTPQVDQGGYVDLGGFPSLIHRHDGRRDLDITVSLEDGSKHPSGLARRGSVKTTFSAHSDNAAILTQTQYRVTLLDEAQLAPALTFHCTLSYNPRSSRPHASWFVSHISVTNHRRDPWEKDAHYDFSLDTEQIQPPQQGFQFLPSARPPRRREQQVVDPSVTNSIIGLASRMKAEGFNRAYATNLVSLMANDLQYIRLAYEDHLGIKMTYLGPLRSPPERTYTISGGARASAGIQGEFMPNILFQDQGVVRAANNWFRRFGIDYEIGMPSISNRVDLVGKRVVSITLTSNFTNRVEVTLADVGFGINQLLPVLIEGIVSPPGSIICVEQPEIHLHPRLQAELGDFLVETAFARGGKQWIIETHSELLARRIQALVADEHSPVSSGDVSILYVDPSSEGSQIIPLDLDEEGDFYDDWPEGFFEEGHREIMRRVARS